MALILLYINFYIILNLIYNTYYIQWKVARLELSFLIDLLLHDNVIMLDVCFQCICIQLYVRFEKYFFLFLNQNKNVFDESFDIIIVFSLNMVLEFYAKRIKGRVWRYFPIWRKIRHFYFFNTRSHRENATQTVVILFFLLIFIFAFDCLLIMSRFCSFCLWWHFGGGSVRF